MNINTSLSGIKSETGRDEAKRIVQETLKKVNPKYVELFEKIGGRISIEQVISGRGESTIGLSRYPHDIAIKTSALSSDTLDRVLTEEIIHYLDHRIGFSENAVFRMQEAANEDAQNPLSLAMLTAVRGGTKGLNSIEDVFKDENGYTLMAEFNKQLPFLGCYHDDNNMDKYEWLAEVEHAERALSSISDRDQANLLSMRAQQNMGLVLVLRYLSNNGIDLATELERTKNNPQAAERLQRRIAQLLDKKDFFEWVSMLSDNVDISSAKTPEKLTEPIQIILLAIAHNLCSDVHYPLSEAALQKMMITMFPESYYALKSFRDEVDRELLKIDRRESLMDAIQQSSNGTANLRAFLAASDMDEVALGNLQEKLQHADPDQAAAIKDTLAIHELIKSHRPDSDEPTKQITALLRNAWPEMRIDGKTIMTCATEKELYSVAIAIRNEIQRSADAPDRPRQ